MGKEVTGQRSEVASCSLDRSQTNGPHLPGDCLSEAPCPQLWLSLRGCSGLSGGRAWLRRWGAGPGTPTHTHHRAVLTQIGGDRAVRGVSREPRKSLA